MGRIARHKSDTAATYHLMTRVAGSPQFFPLQSPPAARQLVKTMRRYLNAYICRLLGFEIMGNHYHLIVHLEKFRRLDHFALGRAAARLYGKRWGPKTAGWDSDRWLRFNRRLYDCSGLMQHINGEFAKWYNGEQDRRGHFWAGRFKNPQLMDLLAIQECLFYVELNAVRAGLVERPEQWPYGSANWRSEGKEKSLLAPLGNLFPATSTHTSYEIYRAGLCLRGALPDNDHSGASFEGASHEGTQTSSRPGLFRSRARFFSDGLAIGSRAQVVGLIDRFRERGLYRRRRNPTPQLAGRLFSLREQRSHAIS